MSALLPHIDPDGLLEFSVVYTDRSLNHMSKRFQKVMNELSTMLKAVYHAHAVALIPGGGTYGMEAVARQFAQDQKVLVLRHGWFSYRWSQILETGRITKQHTVLKARPLDPETADSPWQPAPIEQVCATIRQERPAVVFAPHVETASGMILPDDYLKTMSAAVHEVGGLMVLDCIASGAMWVDMVECGLDVLISAPQKGWSASPCAAMVMLSAAAVERMQHTTSTSFAIDLKKWLQIMQAYEGGGHLYHATLPTDGLVQLHQAMQETHTQGLETIKQAQITLGYQVRQLLGHFGFASVAAQGFQAPGVVVSYTDDPDIQSGKKFMALGLQTAAGVPLQCDEGTNFRTFRLGLFGLDKWRDTQQTLHHLQHALEQLCHT